MDRRDFRVMWNRLIEESEYLDKLYEIGLSFNVWSLDYIAEYLDMCFPSSPVGFSFIMFESNFGEYCKVIDSDGTVLNLKNSDVVFDLATGQIKINEEWYN